MKKVFILIQLISFAAPHFADIFAYSRHFIAAPGITAIVNVDNDPELALDVVDIGTAGTTEMEFVSNHIGPRIGNDMNNGRFTYVACGKDGLSIDIKKSGENASNPDSEFFKKILELNNNSKFKAFINSIADAENIALLLLEPHHSLKSYKHPHLLSYYGKQYSVAYSGTMQGAAKAVYMTRQAFMDFSTDLLADILMVQIKIAIVRYKAWHRYGEFPKSRGTYSKEVHSLMAAINRKRYIKDEITAVHKYELDITEEFAIRPELCYYVISLWQDLSGSFPDIAPVQTCFSWSQKFRDAIENSDYDSAINFWGLITFEIAELEKRLKAGGLEEHYLARLEELFGKTQMAVFKGISEGINASFRKYIAKYGIYNSQGEESGQVVGVVRVINNIENIEQEFRASKGNEVWVLPYMPDRIPGMPGMGLIVSIEGNRHATDTCKEQGVPLAVIPNAIELLKDFNGKPCMFRVEPDMDVRFRPPFPDDETILKPKQNIKVRVPKARVGKNLVYNLYDTDDSFVNFVGPKSAKQGGMKNVEINIPDGFVLSFAFWDRFSKHNKLDKKIQELREKIVVEGGKVVTEISRTEEILEEIKKLIVESEIPKELRDILGMHLFELREKYGHDLGFYVRSTFNYEDLTERTTAGHYDSYPNREFPNTSTDENILTAIKMVFASMWNEKAFYSRVMDNIKDEAVMPAVIIQVPKKAVISGTMYTQERVSGSRNEITVLASHGQGESVVSGVGRPAEVRIDKLTGKYKILQDVSLIDTQIDFIDGHIAELPVTVEHREFQIFTEDLVEKLKDTAELVEGMNENRPQDIEWCVDSSGVLWIVQTRPMKTDSLPTEKRFDDELLSVLEVINESSLSAILEASKNGDVQTLIKFLHLDKGNVADLARSGIQLVGERVQSLAHLPAAVKNGGVDKLKENDIERIAGFVKANVGDAFATPNALKFFRVVYTLTTDRNIKTLIEDLFTFVSQDPRGDNNHLIYLEIARGLIAMKRYNSVITPTRFKDPVHYVSTVDVMDRIIGVMAETPTDASIAYLHRVVNTRGMEDWVVNYARRVIDRLTGVSAQAITPPSRTPIRAPKRAN